MVKKKNARIIEYCLIWRHMYDKIRENFQWVGQKLKNSSIKLEDGQF